MRALNLKLLWEDTPWIEDLIGCPSQLYKPFRVYVEQDTGFGHTILRAQAYCRWRWSDPWTASVMSREEVSGSSFWIADCIPRLPAFKEPEHKQLEVWCEANFPKHAAEIVEAALEEEADSLELRRKEWERLKVELGIKW